ETIAGHWPTLFFDAAQQVRHSGLANFIEPQPMQWLRVLIEISLQFAEGPWLHGFAPVLQVLLDPLFKFLRCPCDLASFFLFSEGINAAGNLTELLLCEGPRSVRR